MYPLLPSALNEEARTAFDTLVKKVPLALTIFLGLATAACSSTPPDEFTQDARIRAEWYPIDDADSAEMKKLNYLARYLATSETRREIAAEVYNVEFIERWSAANYGTAAAMTTDLVTGQLVTNLSLGMDLAISGIVGLYRGFNNGSFKQATQIWLPEAYNGIELVDIESAREAMIQFTEDRLTIIADKYGYSYECVIGCDDNVTPRNYLFKRDENLVRDYQFTYHPSEFGFYVNLLPPIEVSEEDILPLLMGEELKWKTPPNHSYVHFFFSEFNRDETGQINTIVEENGIELLDGNRFMIATEMGRHMMLDFHSTAYTIYGNGSLYPKLFFHNGDVYRFNSNSTKQLLNWKIDMAPTAEQGM